MKRLVIAATLMLALCSGCLYPPQSTCESGPGAPLSYASGAPVPQACQTSGEPLAKTGSARRLASLIRLKLLWRTSRNRRSGAGCFSEPAYQTAPPTYIYNAPPPTAHFAPFIPSPLPSAY